MANAVGGLETERHLALLTEYQRTRESTLRDQIVLAHEHLVRRIARRFTPQVVASFEDLVQVGYIGLIQAVDRYEPHRGVAFTTFATATITGVIRHFLRDEAWLFEAPRSLRELSLRLSVVRRQFQALNGLEPSLEELAGRLEAPAAQIREALELERVSGACSLEALADPLDSRSAEVSRCPAVREPAYDAIVKRGAVDYFLRCLNPRERSVIYQRYLVGQTQTETARRLGISQMHVSRLERRALERLQALAQSAW